MIHKGNIVIIPFPFTDNNNTKLRPAIAVSDQMRQDVILCQITSRKPADNCAVYVSDSDLSEGALRQGSWIRVNKIFTMDSSNILKIIGTVHFNKQKEIHDKLLKLFR
jgi:mRNA interferase MazF